MNKIINKLSKVLNIMFIIICILLIHNVINLNIIPNKYLYIFITVLVVLNITLFYFIWFNKKIKTKINFTVIILILSSISIYGYINLNKVSSFIDSLEEENLQIEYKVVVLKNKFQSIEELKDQSIGYLKDDAENVSDNITFNYNEVIIDNFTDLSTYLINGNVSAIVVESNVLQSLYDEIDGFEEATLVIEKIYVNDSEESAIENKDYEFSLEPLIFYVSGIDQYGAVDTVRGRSDVNILAVVNPLEHKILLVNTPRDYYVKLHSSNAFDKLTHAGIYGIDESVSTIEDLYGIDIDYYVRVNFNTIIDLVDAIGGIDIYSDTNFTAWTDNSCHITTGNISLGGKCALAYARERMSYMTGDRHRGENQQQIISAIISKVTSSKTLLTKSTTLLSTLTGKFKSNAPTSLFTNYIKYQIADMQKWSIESISVDGTDSSNYTYSYGTSLQLYVMNPNYDTVTIASDKIKEYLESN